MKIQFHKQFDKGFKKLSPSLKTKTISAIQKFSKNPFNPTLHNHPLKGKLLGKRAFSITGDIRIIFEEYSNYVLVIFLDIGTHTQVY